MNLNRNQIADLPKTKKIHLINAITGFKPVNLIATRNTNGMENVAVFSSVVHLGSNPGLVGFVLRPTTAQRDTYENILNATYYTINHVHEGIIEQAHQTSASYPKDVSEFGKTGLTPEYIDGFQAPFVQESRVRMGLRVQKVIDIELNGTKFVIGQIEQISIPDTTLVHEHGYLNLEKAESMALVGLDGYHKASLVARKSYATVDQPTRTIKLEDNGK